MVVKQSLHLLSLLGLVASNFSCAATKTIGFYCEEQQIEIYVEGDFLGRGMVDYVMPRGKEYVNVSCKQDGKELYNRTFYVKGKDKILFELQVPKDYRYSNKPY